MNVKGSLAGRKTSSGGALQTLGTGLCQGRVPRLAELPEQGTGGGNAASPFIPWAWAAHRGGKRWEKPSQAGVEVPGVP